LQENNGCKPLLNIDLCVSQKALVSVQKEVTEVKKKSGRAYVKPGLFDMLQSHVLLD